MKNAETYPTKSVHLARLISPLFETRVRSGSRLCENSDVELSRRTFVSMTLNKKRTTLAGAVKRRKERKLFCAFSARGRFHTAWVIRATLTARRSLPIFHYEQTSAVSVGMSQRCQERTLHGVDPSYSSIVNVKLFGRHGRPRASAMSSAQQNNVLA
jgi:hypothetical protein